VVTLADVSSGSGSAARKRPAAASGGSGASSKGGSGGGKRRAVGALQLGSEEGIGASLLGAVGSKKGGAALHGEDPAAAFLRAAASSALAHHVEEVHANERFQAALALASGGSTSARSVGPNIGGPCPQAHHACASTAPVSRRPPLAARRRRARPT
jgi:hypothetical protein